MRRLPLARRIRVLYPFARRHSRGVRSFSLTLLSITIIVSRVVELAAQLMSAEGC